MVRVSSNKVNIMETAPRPCKSAANAKFRVAESSTYASKPRTRARKSERLRMKKNQKELATRSKLLGSEVRDRDQALELSQAQMQIQHGNPAHKVLFLARLGMSPSAGAKIPPYLELDRVLPKKFDLSKCSDNKISNKARLRDSEDSSGIGSLHSDSDDSVVLLNSDEDSDYDLDLELVICPVDIPEFLEEIYIKKDKPIPVKKAPLAISSEFNSRSSRSVAVSPGNSDSTSSSEGFSDDKYFSSVCRRSLTNCKWKRKPASSISSSAESNSLPTGTGKNMYTIDKDSHRLPAFITSQNSTFIDLTEDDELDSSDSLELIRQRLLSLDTEVEYVN